MNVFYITINKINENAFFFGVLPNMLENLLPDIIGQKRLSVFS